LLDGDGYRVVSPRSFKAHRIVWAMTYGYWPGHQIDHINGVRNDNRLCNLREATVAQNQQNQRASPRNASGYPGVSWHKRIGKWEAHITVDGRRHHLGLFDTAREAYAARPSIFRSSRCSET
jgi:hypothetical protein